MCWFPDPSSADTEFYVALISGWFSGGNYFVCKYDSFGTWMIWDVDSLIRAFVHSFVHSNIHSCIHSFIHSCIHTIIHSFSCTVRLRASMNGYEQILHLDMNGMLMIMNWYYTWLTELDWMREQIWHHTQAHTAHQISQSAEHVV